MPDLPNREREALDEIAATRCAPAGSWILIGTLLALSLSGAVLELTRTARGESRVFPAATPVPGIARLVELWREGGPREANRELRESLAALEDRMGRESAISAALRPAAQWILFSRLGYGNSQVIAARDGHLYFQTAFDHLTGPPFLAPRELAGRRKAVPSAVRFEPDPVPGLTQLARELGERGIQFLFFVVPVKAEIHPEPLLRGSRLPTREIGNPATAELLSRLESASVATYDPAAEMRAAALAGEQLYLATDTHWNPAGMRIAARGVARTLRERGWIQDGLPAGLQRNPQPDELQGDLTGLLGLGPLAARIPPERPVLDAVSGPGITALTDVAADVLVLGDSYSVVFSHDREQRAAGFAEQLAFELDRPVRRLAQLAANELPRRVRWLQEDPGALEGVRVVVYEVTARALSTTDWSPTPLVREPQDKRSSP